jgi:hypothetical protein
MIPKDKISKATNVKKVHPVYQQISEDLANIDILRYIKIYNGSIKASNFLSDNGKKEPIIKMGDKDIVGVELLVDIGYLCPSPRICCAPHIRGDGHK